MFIKNQKPIKIIGYLESSMTEEYIQVFLKENLENFEVITPENFILLSDKHKFQYIIGFSLDMNLREKICNILDEEELDCLTYINDFVYLFPSTKIGKGCFISYNVVLSWNVSIENHCYFGLSSGVGHDCKFQKNCIVSPGVHIAGKVSIGKNCQFLFESSVINKINICDNVTLCAFSNLTKNALKSGTYIGTVAKMINKK